MGGGAPCWGPSQSLSGSRKLPLLCRLPDRGRSSSVNMLTRLLAFSLRGGRGFRKLTESPSMWKAVFPVALLLLFSVQAEARPHHHPRHQHFRSMPLFVRHVPTPQSTLTNLPSP